MLHMNGGLFTCICWFLISVCQKEWDKSKQLQLLNELHNMKNPLPLLQLPCHQFLNTTRLMSVLMLVLHKELLSYLLNSLR